jgi:hypothetical protein
LPRVYNTQIPSIASGISGVRSVLNIGTGVTDLILLPLEEYKKEGRVLKGLRKGAKSLLQNTAAESLKISSSLANGTRILLEKAEDMILEGSITTNSQSSSRGTVIAIPTQISNGQVLLIY